MKREAKISAMAHGAGVEPRSGFKAKQLVLSSKMPRSALVFFSLFLLIVAVSTQRHYLVALVDHEITQVKIQGELSNLNAESIEIKLGEVLGKSFLTTDLLQVKASVESLPWVYQSTVARVWPGQIIISVVEQIPVAYWNNKAYFNANGDVFKPTGFVVSDEYPNLTGPNESLKHVRIEMIEVFNQLQMQLIAYELNAAQLELKSRGVWDLTLTNGIVVALGEMPFVAKIARLGTVLSDVTGDAMGRINKIDTRYPNGVAIKWKEIVVADGNNL